MRTQPKSTEGRRGSRRQPEASRNAILQAALAEFAQEGLAGARVDAIAEAAGVNKALLYYYFRDKERSTGRPWRISSRPCISASWRYATGRAPRASAS